MNYNKLYVVGDIHGDYDRLVFLLQQQNLINDHLQWLQDNTALVCIGDLTDRCNKGIEVIQLLMALEKQAQGRGGDLM